MTRSDDLDDTKETLQHLLSEAPELESFFGFVEAVERPGALDTKTKELISIAISVVTQCEDCILWHVDRALDAGATREEILDALQVAVVMGGGPALMYATEAYETVLALEAERN